MPPSHRHHLALCRISIAAYDGLPGGGCDIVRRRNLHRQVFGVAEVEGFHEALLTGLTVAQLLLKNLHNSAGAKDDMFELESDDWRAGIADDDSARN